MFANFPDNNNLKELFPFPYSSSFSSFLNPNKTPLYFSELQNPQTHFSLCQPDHQTLPSPPSEPAATANKLPWLSRNTLPPASFPPCYHQHQLLPSSFPRKTTNHRENCRTLKSSDPSFPCVTTSYATSQPPCPLVLRHPNFQQSVHIHTPPNSLLNVQIQRRYINSQIKLVFIKLMIFLVISWKAIIHGQYKQKIFSFNSKETPFQILRYTPTKNKLNWA